MGWLARATWVDRGAVGVAGATGRERAETAGAARLSDRISFAARFFGVIGRPLSGVLVNDQLGVF
jgi:hypothetical protein